ncbi:MAG: DnaJ C-terminal domain-containing protein, partial [Candidatus Diapherotrites archaeon]
MAKDYYNTLGISKDASPDDIKAAYKKLAKKYHPDVSKEEGAEKKFKEVLEAYNTLRDPQKKNNYDRFGDAAQRFGGFGDFSGAGFQRADFDFGDIFSDFAFGGGGMGDLFRGAFGSGRKRGPQQGESIRFDLGISFEEAAFGIEKEFTIERMEKCDSCKGSGAEKGTKKTRCDICLGTGLEEQIRRTILGTIATRQTCSKCHGEGEMIENLCNKCGGVGRVKARRKMKVKIPAGVNTGNHLRLQEQGNSGERGAPSGDLFVVLFVNPHEFFKRDGTDIFSEIPLSFSEAALGTEIEVPTLRG